MNEFLDFLRKRRNELRKELEALDAAERLYRESGVKTSQEPSLPLGIVVARPAQLVGTPTIKEMVISVLKSGPEQGMTANEILKEIQRVYDPTIIRTSLSPQISRLQQTGVLVNKRPYWLLMQGRV